MPGRDAIGAFQRAFAVFFIKDTQSGRHQSLYFTASHHFGANGSNTITVLSNSAFTSNEPITGIRLKESGTYSGAALQINIGQSTSKITVYMHFNEQENGWVLPSTPLEDTDTTSHDAVLGYGTNPFSGFAVRTTIDLADIEASLFGGIATSGGLVVQKDMVHEGSNVGFFGTAVAGQQASTTVPTGGRVAGLTPSNAVPPPNPGTGATDYDPGGNLHADIVAIATDLDNVITQVGEIKTALQNLGLLS